MMWEKFTFLRSWVTAELEEETFLGLPAVQLLACAPSPFEDYRS